MPKVSDQYKEEKRNTLIQSALHCFGDRGYDSTTVDDIIRHAGVSKGMLYTYFASKEDILLELLRQRTTQMVVEVEQELQRHASPVDRVLVVLRRYRMTPLSTDRKNWTVVYLEFWLASSRHPQRQQLLLGRYETLVGFLAEMIDEGKKQGAFHQDVDARTTAAFYWAMCDGINLHLSQTGDDKQSEAMWHTAEEMLVRHLTRAK